MKFSPQNGFCDQYFDRRKKNITTKDHIYCSVIQTQEN